MIAQKLLKKRLKTNISLYTFNFDNNLIESTHFEFLYFKKYYEFFKLKNNWWLSYYCKIKIIFKNELLSFGQVSNMHKGKLSHQETFARVSLLQKRFFCTKGLFNGFKIFIKFFICKFKFFFNLIFLIFTITVTINPYPQLVTFFLIFN